MTTHSPDLSFSPPPRYACPDLIAREGYWARPVRESVATHGSRLAFSLVPGGQLRLFVNNHHVGRHLTGLPTDQPLWGLVDVYGNTTSVTFVREESVPVEVLSRGQHAVDAFLQAQESGTLPIYRGRLCVLGPPSVGKTSLVRALLGQKASVGQQSTEGIALSHCWATSVGEWREGGGEEGEEGDEGKEGSEGSALPRSAATRSISLSGLRADYDHSLAHTVAREVARLAETSRSSSRLEGEKASLAARSLTSFIRSNLKNSSRCKEKARASRSKNRVSPCHTGSRVPEPIANLVEDFLSRPVQAEGSIPPDCQVDVWDFGGHPELYTSHQLFLGGRVLALLVFDLRRELDSPALVPVWREDAGVVETVESELTHLDFLLVWLNLLHLSSRNSVKAGLGGGKPVTEVVIVGTHAASLASAREGQLAMAEMKFERIREAVAGKPIEGGLAPSMFAVDSSDPNSSAFRELRRSIYNLLMRLPNVGQEIPIKWVRFETVISRAVERQVHVSNLQILGEMAREVTIGREVIVTFDIYSRSASREKMSWLLFSSSTPALASSHTGVGRQLAREAKIFSLMSGGSSTGSEALRNTVLFSPTAFIRLVSPRLFLLTHFTFANITITNITNTNITITNITNTDITNTNTTVIMLMARLLNLLLRF